MVVVWIGAKVNREADPTSREGGWQL